MAITVTAATRSFNFNGVDLPDPGPTLSTEDVRDLYSATYAVRSTCWSADQWQKAANRETGAGSSGHRFPLVC